MVALRLCLVCCASVPDYLVSCPVCGEASFDATMIRPSGPHVDRPSAPPADSAEPRRKRKR